MVVIPPVVITFGVSLKPGIEGPMALVMLLAAAFRANTAGRQYVYHARQDLHDTSGQIAVLAVEVNTLSFLALRRKAKDVARIGFPG